MDIYPEDLGPRHCRQVLEDRLLCVGGARRASAPSVSPSGRVQERARPGPAFLWVYPFGLPFAALLSACGFNFWSILLIYIAFAIFFHWGFLRRGAFGGNFQHSQRHMTPSGQQDFSVPQASTYTRLTEPEVTSLLNALLRKGNDDPLLGMYLELVWGAMHLDPLATGQAETEQSVREAIRALGGAIESLPPQTLDGVPDSDASLQAVAARLASEATGETDPVVAASLGRRVEALRGQAETVARVRVLLRRNLALREELADQIGALRTSLAAAALSGDDSGPELAGLAARIRRVASEANAVTAARVEVDTLLSQTRASVRVAGEEVRQQRVGLNGETL